MSTAQDGFIRFAAKAVAVAVWLAMTLPSTAVTATYRNDFRSCAGRLLSVNIAENEAAIACAAALRPRDLSKCVVQIREQTTIAVEDALGTCRQVRRPDELARCVVGISRNSQDDASPAILNYCRRSLLPVRFAECVVGLRREIDFAPLPAMENCIDASDQPRQFSPTFVPTPDNSNGR